MISINTESVLSDVLELAHKNKKSAQDHLERLRKKTCEGREWTGWFDYPKTRGRESLAEIEAWSKSLDLDYDTIVVIGIGGSYLGTRAVAEGISGEWPTLLADQKHVPIIYLGHHLSPYDYERTFAYLKNRKPLINVISKSGTTTEPGVAFRLARTFLEDAFGAKVARQRIVATTDARKGALRSMATAAGYQTFVVPDDIGGRYSVLTPVGMVPLILAGYDGAALLAGAQSSFDALSSNDTCLKYAALRSAAYERKAVAEVLALSDPRLRSFGEWWKQLFGESEGKNGRGLFPASVMYTTDLHSLGQYMQDGPRFLLETFLSRKEKRTPSVKVPKASDNVDELGYLENTSLDKINDAANKATRLAHFEGGISCIDLICDDDSERGLGELIAFMETACAVSAALIGVNPFDQPGVETYKKKLFSLMGKPGF